jgi:DNA primase
MTYSNNKNDTIDTLKNFIYPRLSHEIIFSDLEPKDRGKRYVMTCPFCQERNEFYALKGSQWGQCNRKNHCGKGINWWNYIKEKFSLSSNQAVLLKLAELSGVQLPKSQSAITPQIKKQIETGKMYDLFFLECKRILLNEHKNPTVKQVYDYLAAERGFTPVEIQNLDFGYFPDKKYVYSYLEEQGFNDNIVERSAIGTMHYGGYYRLVIPYRDICGRIEGFVCRLLESPDDTIKEHYDEIMKRHPWFKKGSPIDNILCGLTPIAGIKTYISSYSDKSSEEYVRLLKLENDIDIKKYKYSFGLKTPFFNIKALNNKSIYIVEGIFDVLKLLSKGIANVVGLGRDSICSSHIDAIKNSRLNEIYFIPDCDNAGMNAVKESIRKVIPYNVKTYVVTYSKYKDADEYIRAEGVKPLKKDIASAERAEIWLIKTMIQLPIGGAFTDSYKEKQIEEMKSVISTVPDKGIRSLMCNIVKEDKDYKRPIARDVEMMVSKKKKENKVKANMEFKKEVDIAREELSKRLSPLLRNGNTKEMFDIVNKEFNDISVKFEFMESDAGNKYMKHLTAIIDAIEISDYKKLKKLVVFRSNNIKENRFDSEEFKKNMFSTGYEYYVKGKYSELKEYLDSLKKKLTIEMIGHGKSQDIGDCTKLIDSILTSLQSKNYSLLRLLLLPQQ